MSTRKRSHRSRSPHPDTGIQRTIDEPGSLDKRLSTKKYRLSSIVLAKKHEIEEGEIEVEKLITSPDQKKNSLENPSETHQRSNFPKQESSVCIKLSNEAKIKDDSLKQLSTTKHGSMEASKFSDKQNCGDEAKNGRNSSLNAPKWEYETCIKGIPKTSVHRQGPMETNECHNSKKIRTSLQWSSSKLNDENKTKDAKKSSSSGWSSWDSKEADTSITHKSACMKWDSWPSDDIKADPSRNSVKWGSDIDINDAKMLSNPKLESRNSMETNEDQSYMKDSHKSSSSKHRLWDDENKTKNAWKSSSSKWSSWDCKEADTNITQKSSAKWDSWPSDDIKADSSRNNAKRGSEIDAKDGNKYSSPKLESMNSNEAKRDQSYTKDSQRSSNSKWGHKTIHRDANRSCPKWGSLDSKKIDSNSLGISWSSTRRNINSSLNDSRWAAETNAVEAVKSSGPEWSSWDSKKSKSDSSWYVSKWISEIHLEDPNISPSQKLSSWESNESNIKSTSDDPKQVTETNAKDALTFSVPKLDSSNCNEAKTNSNWDSCNLKGSDTNSSWDRFIVKINPKDADKSSSAGWGSWDANENNIKATLPCADIRKFNSRQGGSKAPTDCWNSQKSSTTSWNDSKWRRDTNTKITPKWGKSSIDERAPHYSARHRSNNNRHLDEAETNKRKSSGSKSKDHRLNISASEFKDSRIGTVIKQSSCRDHIDEKTHSKLRQNDSKWGSWNDIKDSKTHNVSSWSGPKWGDQTAKNEGASERRKDESNSAIPLNCFKQREGNTGNGICCLPNNIQKTSEYRNGYAMNNEMNASCEAFQKTIPSGMHVSSNEAFGYDQHDMKFFGHGSNGYVIEHTEDNKVEENDENKKLPPYESQKQSFGADLHNKAKNITQYSVEHVTLDPHHLKNKAAVEALNIWVQSSSAAGASSSNQSTEACGTKIIEGKKEDIGILMLKSAVADFVKDILKPYWKGGHLSREDHKTIVRKVVCKVMGSLQENIIPVTEKYIEDYMAYNRIKLTNLVAAYLDIFQTAQAAKKMEATNIQQFS